jgi:hypothetical protein
MRLQTLRLKKYNGHLFVQRCFSNSSNYMRGEYDDYDEYQLDKDFIDSIWNHDDFMDWYHNLRGISLIPRGWRGNELRFLIPNRFNSKRFRSY